jgi:hypothetical protein
MLGIRNRKFSFHLRGRWYLQNGSGGLPFLEVDLIRAIVDLRVPSLGIVRLVEL